MGKMALAYGWTHQIESLERSADTDLIVIQHLAAIAARRGRLQLAAQLLGFIDLMFVRGGLLKRPPTEQRSYAILTQSIAAQLSSEEIAHERIAGEALDFRTAPNCGC